MGYRQPFVITVNKTGSESCDPDNGLVEVWQGTACICDDECVGDDVIGGTKQYQCIDDDLGTCVEGAGNDPYVSFSVQGQCSCGSLPPGNQCTTPDVRTVSMNCNCNPANCTTPGVYREGQTPADGVHECPQFTNYYNGCGSFSLTCGSSCAEYFACSDDINGGQCVCDTSCEDLGWECGTHPCGSSYGNCDEAGEVGNTQCNYCDDNQIVDYTADMFFQSQPANSYEYGSGSNLTATLRHRYLTSTIDIGIKKPDGSINWQLTGVTLSPTSDCYRFRNFSISFVPELDGTLGNHRLMVRDNGGDLSDLQSNAINVVDNIRAGCMDRCADNFDSNATVEIGPDQPTSCTYSGCTDSLGVQYFCSTGNPNHGMGGCNYQNSYPCKNLVGQVDEGYEFEDVEEDCSCTFEPDAVITLPPGEIFEGTSLNIIGYNSIPFVLTPGGPYDDGGVTCTEYTDTITSHTWNLSVVGDNITEGQDDPSDTWGPDYIEQIGINIPFFDGGGGILSVDLTVQNSTGLSNTLANYNIGIGDVDIIGTQISEFPAIYIPGGGQFTYVPCLLPPGEYDIQQVLLASLYENDPTGEENPIPWYNGWSPGDLVSTRICYGVGCNFNTTPPTEALIGGSMYVDGTDCSNGYDASLCPLPWLGTTVIESGAAYLIQTLQPGWIKWTVPMQGE